MVPVIVVRLAFIHESQKIHGDHLADSFRIAVVTVVHTNLNVIVTCLSFIKPVTEGLQTGILAADLPRTTASVTPRYRLEHFGKGSSGDVTKSRKMFASHDSGESGERRPSENSHERMIVQEGIADHA